MSKRWFASMLVTFVWLAGAACGPRAKSVKDAELPHDQWSRGVWLYGQHCAGCHGENGEGSEDAPALVGAEALPESAPDDGDRKASFVTMQDVFGYASTEMPPMDPGSIAADDHWAILAYISKSRGLDLDGKILNATNAPSLKLR